MLAVFVIIAAVIVFANAARGFATEQRADTTDRDLDALAHAAKRNGAKLSVREDKAIVERDGIAIEITLSLRGPTTMTWRVTVPPPGTIRYRLYPEHFGAFMNHMFGSFELPPSTLPALQGQFSIVTDDEAALRTVWTDERCALLVEQFLDKDITSDGSQLDISQPTGLDISRVDAGIRLLFGLASVDLWGFADLQAALPDGTFKRAGGFVEMPGPGRVRVGLARGDLVHTYARGEAGDLAKLPAAIRERATELGADSIELVDGEVIVEWSGIERDPQRLTGCVELLRGLVAVPSDGVFR